MVSTPHERPEFQVQVIIGNFAEHKYKSFFCEAVSLKKLLKHNINTEKYPSRIIQPNEFFTK